MPMNNKLNKFIVSITNNAAHFKNMVNKKARRKAGPNSESNGAIYAR